MTVTETSSFERVREIVADWTRVDPEQISLDTDLVRDLGVSGDDGEELFEKIDRTFDIDWTGLDLGVHFGPEISVPPLPWNLKDNSDLFEPQPCRVLDLVKAVDTGAWPGTKLVPRSKFRLTLSLLFSILYWGVLGLIAFFGVLALLIKLFR